MINFMGARLDPFPTVVIENRLVDFLCGDDTKLITTPNPEMLILGQKSEDLQTVLHQSDLGCVDGTGVVGVLKMKGIHGVERVTGVDTMWTLAKLCSEQNKKIMLVGARPGVAAEAKQMLLAKYPNLHIHSYVGPNMSYKIEGTSPFAKDDEEVLQEIENFQPDVLAIALGAGKQEIWLNKYKDRFSSVKILIGIGGAFDMISGALPRAPLFFRKIGLEWMWRLLLQPTRIARIMRAVVVFPLTAIKHDISYERKS